ncbi:MAG: AI-2E family transporter [Bacteroidetes bacterium]|nr:AI-2E family transporter [Bacteroidota bacterium]
MQQNKPLTVSMMILTAIVAGVVLYILRGILVPFVVAGLLSMLYKPVIALLRKWHIPLVICLLIVLVITAGALWGMYLVASLGVTSAIEKAPFYADRFSVLMHEINDLMRRTSMQFYGRSGAIKLDSLFSAGSIVSMTTQFFGSAVSFVGDSVLVLLFLVFMILGDNTFTEKLVAVFKNSENVAVADVIANVNMRVRTYLGVKTLLNACVGVITWLTLMLFGVDFAEVFGLMAFLLLYIPNVGSFFATVLPALVTLLQFGSVSFTAIVTLTLIVEFNIIGNLIEPKILGQSLDLSPVLVLFSLLFWGFLWGPVGMILSVPMMAILRTVFEAIPTTRPLAILMSNKAPAIT